MSESKPVPKVYAAMNAVASRLARTGINKSGTNEHYHYNFRGIDQMFNTLGPILAELGLIITPRVMHTEVRDFVTSGGSTMFNVMLDVEYDLVAVEDGSLHTLRVRGEGMDSGDKATNKAMSAAYKLMAIQGFCIPIEPGSVDDADRDAPLREAAGRGAFSPQAIAAAKDPIQRAGKQPPDGFVEWHKELVAAADKGRAALSRVWKMEDAPERDQDRYQTYRDHIDEAYPHERDRLKTIADAVAGKPVM